MSADKTAKLRHDLMAPICNVKAYTSEVHQVGLDLECLLREYENDLPESLQIELKNIISSDINICTKALDNASASLERQLEVLFSQ